MAERIVAQAEASAERAVASTQVEASQALLNQERQLRQTFEARERERYIYNCCNESKNCQTQLPLFIKVTEAKLQRTWLLCLIGLTNWRLEWIALIMK